MTSRRLPEAVTERIDRSQRVRFTLDGRTVEAFAGDSVGSAMAGAGIDITGRSFKYHRPRGLFCMTGACPNCLVDVDGVPNVRACVEPVRDGMRVRRQNGWPGVDRDAGRLIDVLSFLLPVGFYYKLFQRPRFAWPLVEPFIRRVAGLGRAPKESRHARVEKVSLHPDVLVVGGGAAGLAAAAAAAGAGADTVVIEESAILGGSLLASTELIHVDGLGEVTAPEAASALARRAEAAGARILPRTPAFGVFGGLLVGAAGADALYRIRARRIVFATGSLPQPAVFTNNDLPGVMLGEAAERLVQLYRVLPGKRAVVLTSDTAGYRTAQTLAATGAQVTVVDVRLSPPQADVESAQTIGIVVHAGATVLKAVGRRRVRRVAIGPATGEKSTRTTRLLCDLLALTLPRVPTTNLLAQSGATLAFDAATQSFLPVGVPDGCLAAGAVAGASSAAGAIADGTRAGARAARELGFDTGPVGETTAESPEVPGPVTLPPVSAGSGGKRFVCLCMDVTDKEIEAAVTEGFDSIELLKRYTTLSMGPCQGRACLSASIRTCAAATGRSVAKTGAPTARPPWTPVSLGVLASNELSPRKETSIHDCHADLNAEFMWAGDWRRPHHYTDPAEECRAVHGRVGLIDVSSLGKLRVKGPDAVTLLERLYPNRFSDLKVGRVRYGVTLNDAGVILDDGTVCRLADDEFYLTTTTGGTEAMEKWISWWLADWGLRVNVANVSAAFGAVNIAGPLARDVMTRLTDADVSADAMPYLKAAKATVAGVDSLILRIGFVGELGYEIHFASAYGEHVWDAILDAGRDFGIAPFGMEAQRILRLEKQHILVGQDTDALSDPYGAGMSWIVKLDKEDFLGRQMLGEISEGGPDERLVGFRVDGEVVPPEGAAIVRDGRWIGRVTSSRRSDEVGGVIGMGWVPLELSEEGKPIDIKFDGFTLRGAVTLKPFYDPEGRRLRS